MIFLEDHPIALSASPAGEKIKIPPSHQPPNMISPDSLPHLPGCYLFKDSREEVIYVGKARDLRKRVSSYIQKQDHEPRTAALVAAASGLDFIVTNSELEALLLENTLIKKHQPRYNIKL